MMKQDNFDKIYKGEISKSGTAILPSKRLRRMPEKVNISTVSVNADSKEEEEAIEQPEPESLPAENKTE